MKTFRSVDALKKAALSKGASASVGGQKFNILAEKVNATQQPPEEPKPEPVQAPEPIVAAPVPDAPAPVDLAPIVQSAVDAMASSVSQVAQDNLRVMGEVTKAIERLASTQQPTPADPSRHWKLTVNRDTRGFMDTVDIKRIA